MLLLGVVSMRLAVLATALFSAVAAQAQPTARFDDPARPAAPTAAPRPAPVQEPWARSAARTLVERAERYERRGDTLDALRVYNDAIRMDPSHGPAYLGLGRLRHALRDLDEADRLYSAAARLPQSAAEALERRARVRRDQGRLEEAVADLRASIDADPSARERHKTLAAWYVERKAWPAALGVWRRLAAELEASGPSDELRQARIQVRALSLLAGEADPVQGGRGHPSWVRRSIARIAGQP
jgi:tetratricopeptide (TPR) repeat protein